MTDPRTPTSDPVAAEWHELLLDSGIHYPNTVEATITRHRLLIEAEARQQARAAFALEHGTSCTGNRAATDW